ncbi:HNH endonuclease [Paenibacillus anseongensis]
MKKHDNKCFYCGEKMTKNAGLKQRTRDHLIPLSRGVSDYIENIVPACRSCNSFKGTKTVDEFLFSKK